MQTFHCAVSFAGDEEIHIAEFAGGVAFLNPGEGDDLHVLFPGSFDGRDNVGRTAGATDGDEQIALMPVPADGCGEGLIVAEIVAKGGQARDVVEGHGTDAGIFAAVQRHVTRHGRARAVAHKVMHVSGVIGRASELQPLVETFGSTDFRAVSCGRARAAENVIQGGAVGIEIAHNSLECRHESAEPKTRRLSLRGWRIQ